MSVSSRVLWCLFQARLYRPDDRALLEDIILPHYVASALVRRVLFVGYSRHSRRHLRVFQGRELVVLDRDPSRRPPAGVAWVNANVTQLSKHFAPGCFDLIVMNGVIGWGLDDPVEISAALKSCAAHLAPRGTLVVSTDAARPGHDALPGSAARCGLTPAVFAPLDADHVVTHVPWHVPTEHTYYFFGPR